MKKHWRFSVACASCLAVVAFAWGPRELEPIAGSTAVIAPGSVIARLRERLVAANEAGTIRPEVGRLLSDQAHRVLMGVPELFPDLAAGVGRKLRLRTNASVVREPKDAPRPEAFAAHPVLLERFGAALSRDELARAIVGEGEVAGHSTNFGDLETRGANGGAIRAPIGWRTQAVLLAGTKLSLVGIRNGGLLVTPPPWAAAALGTSPHSIVPWGLATREAE